MATAKEHDIVAAFPDERRARRAVDTLARRGVRKSHLRLVPPMSKDPTRVGEMQAEMQDEASESVAGPGVVMTASQAKGALTGVLTGGLIGLLVGLLVGALWGWLAESAIAPAGRLAIAAACFAIAGGTVGAVMGGSLKPRAEAARKPGVMLDERRLAGERDTLVAVHVTDDREAGIAEEVLKESGATRIDSIDDEGSPMAPQAEHPRPADPPGWWENNGKRGG